MTINFDFSITTRHRYPANDSDGIDEMLLEHDMEVKAEKKEKEVTL